MLRFSLIIRADVLGRTATQVHCLMQDFISIQTRLAGYSNCIMETYASLREHVQLHYLWHTLLLE